MDHPMNRVEQDRVQPSGGNELPTYDDLAQQNGPNSRFGRWRGWIEKRAAERYNDTTPEELQRRRERGWDLHPRLETPQPSRSEPVNVGLPPIITQKPPTPCPLDLEIQTSHLNLNDDVEQPQTSTSSLQPSPFVSRRIEPSHLRLSHFGSRFLPHSTSQIRCILPLHSERLLLIGHDEGLSVVDLFPQEWSETGGISVKSPDEAHTRLIWEGEGVFQMSILEQGENHDGTTRGVVLLLVGPEAGSPSTKDGDSLRSLRMYNLLSLSKLAKWTVAHKDASPLDLRRPPDWQVQTSPVKKHRQHSSIARGLKSLMDAPPTMENHRPVSYHTLLGPGSGARPTLGLHSNVLLHEPDFPQKLTPSRRKSSSTDLTSSSWDVVDEAPLRWATDFVPLATANSRLASLVVTSYAIWTDENRIGRGGQLLAVASKNNILLYEVPKGERLFRFVKEFYTPVQPRSITFFHQIVHEVTRSVSEVTSSSNNSNKHRRSDSSATLRQLGDSPRIGSQSSFIDYGTQLSLFVIFDKKAGWIRIADSAVGEMELPDDSYISGLNQDQGSNFLNPRDSMAIGSHSLRSRLSFEHSSQPKWIPLVQCELPVPRSSTCVNEPEATRKVLFLTRGRKTHIMPSPLPSNYAAYPSLAIITWKSPPRSITPRVCEKKGLPFLQLVAFGEDGVEVQEMSLNFISRGKGKGRARVEEVVRAEDDVVGDCGFLSMGGHWDQLSRWMDPTRMSRSTSTSSVMSTASYDSSATSVMVSQLKREEGIYAWWRKDVGDYRVFWVGGSTDHDDPFLRG